MKEVLGSGCWVLANRAARLRWVGQNPAPNTQHPAATAALGMSSPAAARTPVTTKGLAPLAACMTAHQAWVWEKAVLSVPAVVLVPPHICP